MLNNTTHFVTNQVGPLFYQKYKNVRFFCHLDHLTLQITIKWDLCASKRMPKSKCHYLEFAKGFGTYALTGLALLQQQMTGKP